MSKGTCRIEGCSKPEKAKGLCGMHHERNRRHGDPLTVGYIQGDDVARFWSKVAKGDGCWLWTGSVYKTGYAAFTVAGRPTLAHRYSYELNVGPIPEGLTIDHVYANGCRHRHCVNPAHLEAVTQAENNRRKVAAA